MGVHEEVWGKEVASKLYPNNSIVKKAQNDDKYATAKKVTLVVAGADPEVLLDNSTYPLVPTNRTDAVVEYDVRKLESRPTLLNVGLEDISLSYDKRQDVLKSHRASLQTKSTQYCIDTWAPSGTITDRVIRTAGADRKAIVKGATGNRKMITLEEIITAAELLDELDVPEAGRIAFFPAKMKNDLLRIPDIRKSDAFGQIVLPTGKVDTIAGFMIMWRSQAAVYDNVANPSALNMLANNTLDDANAAALFYHPAFVRKGFYKAQVTIGQKMPEYSGGRSLNAVMRMGATPAYNDYMGIVSVVEDHP